MLLIGIWTPVWAQQQTLFSDEIQSGGYGAPVVKFSTLDNDFAVLVGGQGAWIINHAFAVGGAGYGFVTTHYLDQSNLGFAERTEGGYGGLLLEYYVLPLEIVHFRISSIIGAGGMVLLEGRRGDYHQPTIDDTAFFVAEPGAGIGVTVTSVFRVSVEASYRFIVGSSLLGLSDSDLSGPAGMISFQFGAY